jgi:hypothetical protein
MRAALATYLQKGVSEQSIPYLSTVFPHFPKFTPEPEMYSAYIAGIGTGVVIYLHIDGHSEARIAEGGTHSGRKFRSYAFEMRCYLKSTKPKTEEASADNDTFIDGLTAWIQADRNLGTAPGTTGYVPVGAVFQAGEGGQRGGEDLRVTSLIPVPIDLETTVMYSQVDITVCEVLVT